MVAIPLGIGVFSRAPSNHPAVVLKNMIIEKQVSGASEDEYERLQRPGLTAYANLGSAPKVRGLHYTQGLHGSLPLTVINGLLCRFNGAAVNAVGTVADDGGLVQFASTNFGTAVLSAGILYFHDSTSSGTTTVAIPGGETPVSIASINSYVIVVCSTGRWYWLEPGELVIDALHFATAESLADDLVGVMAVRSEIFFFGQQSMEVWQPTGDADLILQRASGREWDKGLMSRDSLQRFDNDAVFVGNDGIVYRLDSMPQRISHTGIEERIRGRTGNLSACTYTLDGHAVYALHVPGQGTFAFDVLTGQWAEFSSADGTSGWRPRVSCAVADVTLMGDSVSGKVFKLDPSVNTDDGQVFERAISGAVPFHGARQRNDTISVHVGTNVGCEVRMRVRDGLSPWSAYRSKTATALSEILYFFRLGAAKQPVRVVEFSCVQDSPFRVSGAWANEGRY